MAGSHPPADTRRVRQALLKKVAGDEEMFALGASVARVVQMASSDDQGTQDLAYYVLSDAGLTQRILRLSNTAQYRTVSGTSVTTISRAISLLGFDNVKATALGMLLVDALANSKHAASVRVELETALCASLVGREMARHTFYQNAEEGSIGALFKNLGPVLVATHEHERYREISQLAAGGKLTLSQASQMILGCTYETLTETVLGEWKIPDAIVRTLAPLPPGELKTPANRNEWLRQVASLSYDVARLLARTDAPAAHPDAKVIAARYGESLNLDADQLTDLFSNVHEQMVAFLQSMDMERQMRVRDPEPVDHDAMPDVLLLATMDAGLPAESGGSYPSGKPKNARDLLLAGVQDVTQMRAAGKARLNELILAVLESLYTSMGFRFATVCLKDAKTGHFRARVSFGEVKARQEQFVFPVESDRDIFHLAMENDADLMIADSTSAKIRELLPAWYRKLMPDAQSFIVLPLVVGKVQVGLFYADRTVVAPEGVPPDETSLIKALKGQVLAALAG
ncbi:HDOD domain-containing protein [Massilia arenosa]|uniref:HDOD domain-containing protein n=1 Tax=Zemynaea arenosa TaxID=2561931 RepID=A0A4Y9RU67_9BURK|nr:HDOD domain-containing protein [Massilia arenosa]TFW11405.1 HDOD domain-containing protein [Massilia arenosa]